MGSKVILIAKGGAVTAPRIRKPPAPRSMNVWRDAARRTAVGWLVEHYALRSGGCWRIFSVGWSEPVKTFPKDAPQEAVEMMLLAKESRHA